MNSLPSQADPRANETVKSILSLAETAGCKLYLVGGYIRDALLGRTAKDYKDFDFMVMPADSAQDQTQPLPAISFAKELADKFQGHFVLLDESNDTARVVMDNSEYFDFAGCVGGTIESDMARRDFTINALACDLSSSNQIVDLVSGIPDLKTKTVRVVKEQSFIDDPLRLLRAFRFAATLGFEIDPQTLEYIRKHCSLISNVSAERITSEMFIMLEADECKKQIVTMGQIGLLEEIFIELKATRRVTKNAFHHLDLFDHSVEALVQCEQSMRELPDWAKERMREPLAQGVSRLAATKLASLLHDIGKPETWVINDDGKHTFIGHDKLGAEMCEPLAKRMKWAKPVERLIEKLVRWHLRPGHLFQQGIPTDKAKYRFYRTIGEELPELILLALADFRSTCGPGLQDGRREAEQNLFELLSNYSVYEVVNKKEDRLLDGTDLMAILDLSPGPVVGQLLEDLLEAQTLGEIKDKEQAASLARKLYDERYNK